jgi:Glycosyltransferase family 87
MGGPVIRRWVMRITVAVLCVVALQSLARAFYSAVWTSEASGDLRFRYEELHNWFAGKPPSTELDHVYYPPASYIMLWPFLGWLSFPMAKLFWALIVLAMLGWLSWLVLRDSGAETPMERAFIALLPLSMSAARMTLWIGQLSAHVLAPLLAGLSLLNRPQPPWREDMWIALLLLAALVKPTFSAPFFWIVLFVGESLRPAWLIGVGYIVVTLLALAFHGSFGWGALFGWARSGAQHSEGHAHLPALLVSYGLETWILPLSLLLLAGLGVWVYRHRRGDLWLLLGVTALVTRFWTYHQGYDDLLILLPMVALFRLAKQAPACANSRAGVAGVLLAVTVVGMLVPHRLHAAAEHAQLSPPLNWLFTWGYACVWMLILIFLLDVARCQRRGLVLKNSTQGGVGT